MQETSKKEKHADARLIDLLLKFVFPPVGEKGSKKDGFGSLESAILGNLRIKDGNKFNIDNKINNNNKLDGNDFSDKKARTVQNGRLEMLVKFGAEDGNLLYTAEFARKKENDESRGYNLRITYEDNGSEERLGIEVVPTSYGLMTLNYGNKNEPMGQSHYSISIINKRNNPEKNKNNNANNNYSIRIVYEDNYNEERLSISYRRQVEGYLQKHIEGREDFTERVPLKWLNVLPETMMGSVLGFTYIGDPSMGRRADLTGGTARMVDIHESIHTPDEYETRVLTEWILSGVMNNYIK